MSCYRGAAKRICWLCPFLSHILMEIEKWEKSSKCWAQWMWMTEFRSMYEYTNSMCLFEQKMWAYIYGMTLNRAYIQQIFTRRRSWISELKRCSFNRIYFLFSRVVLIRFYFQLAKLSSFPNYLNAQWMKVSLWIISIGYRHFYFIIIFRWDIFIPLYLDVRIRFYLHLSFNNSSRNSEMASHNHFQKCQIQFIQMKWILTNQMSISQEKMKKKSFGPWMKSFLINRNQWFRNESCLQQ